MPDDTSTDQLVAELRAQVAARRPGDRLPSTRQLVEAHRVSPVTVSRALTALAAEGLLETRPGLGTFVGGPAATADVHDLSWQTAALGENAVDARGIAPMSEAPGDSETISLAVGYLHPSLMPTKLLGAALARAARVPDVWTRPAVGGITGLRTWFTREAPPGLDPRDVTITSGGQSALNAVLRALVRPGEPLVVESPTYPGMLGIARAAGIRVIPVPVDADGVIPELLDDALRRTGARAFYAQPTFQNPTGATLAADRRADVLAAAAASGAFVIEDDFARWLSHDGRPPRPLLADDDDGRVVHIASLTKVASPGLRIGAVIARGPVAQRVLALEVIDEMFAPRPLQEAALDLVSRPGWSRHLAALSRALARRSAVLNGAIADHLPACSVSAPPHGSYHLWLRLPDGCDEREVVRAAREHNVIVMAGVDFHPAEPPAPHLRITFAATPTEADLVTAVRRLAAAVPALVG